MPAAGTAGEQPAPAAPPATGEQLGETGLKALTAERDARTAAEARAKAAEEELTKLREAGQSEHEKALNQAKREASAEERTRWQAHIRSTEVRSHLRAAGLTNEKSLGLAAAAPEFGRLKVTDEGAVEQVAETVQAFKKDHPELFGAPPAGGPGGPWGGAEGGGAGRQPETLEGAVMDRLAKQR